MFQFPRPKLVASVTVGERGQIVIPSEARADLKIDPGTKLLVFMMPGNDALMVTRPEAFEERAKMMQNHFADMLASQESVKEEHE
jgi:AbrB family looped-hinge helix DNA binding protein